MISIVEVDSVSHEAQTLTTRSPLGQDLAEHQPEDTTTDSTPQGTNRIQLIAVKLPT